MTFSGRVQGVGFRATTREIARRFPVTGWVRNEPDGSVRLEVQGEPDQVEAVLRAVGEALRPNISSIRAESMLHAPQEEGFEIRRW